MYSFEGRGSKMSHAYHNNTMNVLERVLRGIVLIIFVVTLISLLCRLPSENTFLEISPKSLISEVSAADVVPTTGLTSEGFVVDVDLGQVSSGSLLAGITILSSSKSQSLGCKTLKVWTLL